MRRSYRQGGPNKVCDISVGDRVHAGVRCLDGLQRAFSHQGEKSTAERVTLSDTTSRGDVDGAGWVVSLLIRIQWLLYAFACPLSK